MATHLGVEGSLTADAGVVAEVTSFNFTERTSLVVDTALGDAWETHAAGLKSWDGAITAMIDPDDTAGQEVLLNGASVALVLFVEGTASLKKRYAGTVTIEEIAVTVSGNDEITERAFTFKGNGAITIDTVPVSKLWDYIAANDPERLRIVIPEWGPDGEPFIGYASVATVADEVRVRNMVKSADSPDAWARLVFNKLVDENGDRCFKGVGFADFQNRIPAEISRRIGQQIYLGTVITVEQAEGN